MKATQTLIETIIKNVEKVIVGKREVVELAVISLLSQGHLLIEDVPGMGIRSELDDEAREELVGMIDALEKSFLSGQLADEFLV